MATCYGQDGNPDPDYAPCNQSALLEHRHTSCCKKGEDCLTNGLCRHASLGTDTNYWWLEGCTDPTFSDPACSIRDKCRDWDSLYWKCTDTNSWCCNNGGAAPLNNRTGHLNTTCCDMTEFMFNAPAPTVYTTAAQIVLPISTLLPSSETSMSHTSTSVLALTSSTTSTRSTTPTNNIPTDLSPPTHPSGPQNKSSIDIGVGVGIGVGVVAFSAILYVLLRRKKKRHNELRGNEIAELSSPDPRFELHGSVAAAEVMGEKVIYEMRA